MQSGCFLVKQHTRTWRHSITNHGWWAASSRFPVEQRSFGSKDRDRELNLECNKGVETKMEIIGNQTWLVQRHYVAPAPETGDKDHNGNVQCLANVIPKHSHFERPRSAS